VLKKTEKKYVRNYYGIALVLNLILPTLLAILIIGNKTGEVQLGYIFILVWGFICALVYSIYFAIPKFEKWEKIIGLLLPTLLLSVVLIKSWNLIIVILMNLVMNGIFIWHLKKKTFANTV
jgi:hypothetical protein